MKKRNPKSEEIKQKMNQLITGQAEHETGEQMLSALIRLAVQKTVQESLEQELTEHLGRDHYKDRDESGSEGYPNGKATNSGRRDSFLQAAS